MIVGVVTRGVVSPSGMECGSNVSDLAHNVNINRAAPELYSDLYC